MFLNETSQSENSFFQPKRIWNLELVIHSTDVGRKKKLTLTYSLSKSRFLLCLEHHAKHCQRNSDVEPDF